MKYAFFSLILLSVCFLSSCEKPEQEIEYIESNFTVNIVLDDDLRIYHVEKIGGDLIFDRYTFDYSDSLIIVEKLLYDTAHVNRIYYYLEGDRVVRSIDSTLIYPSMYLYELHTKDYTFDDNGYLLEFQMERVGYNNNPDGTPSFTYYSTEYFDYTNGNKIKWTKHGDCVANYSHSSIEKKMDLEYFLGNYLGTMDQNVVSLFYSDCVAYHSPIERNYEVNEDGLITQMQSFIHYRENEVNIETITYNYDFQ